MLRSISGCVCVLSIQRLFNGVFGQREHSSGVPSMGSERTGVQGEDRQGAGPAVSSDRLEAENTGLRHV